MNQTPDLKLPTALPASADSEGSTIWIRLNLGTGLLIGAAQSGGIDLNGRLASVMLTRLLHRVCENHGCPIAQSGCVYPLHHALISLTLPAGAGARFPLRALIAELEACRLAHSCTIAQFDERENFYRVLHPVGAPPFSLPTGEELAAEDQALVELSAYINRIKCAGLPPEPEAPAV